MFKVQVTQPRASSSVLRVTALTYATLAFGYNLHDVHNAWKGP